MASLLMFCWVVFATSALQAVMSKPQSDPVADVCSPLCKEDTILEAYCESLLGCSDIDINFDPDIFLDCWSPCLDLAEQCFNLCANRFDDILQKCYSDCRTQEDPVSCIASCFDKSFLDVKQRFLLKTDNSTNVSSSDVVVQETPTERPPTPTNESTVNVHQLSPLISEVLDSPVMNEDFSRERRLNPNITINNEIPDLNITSKIVNTNTNNTAKVGRSDTSKIMKVETSVSNNTFRVDIQVFNSKNSKAAHRLEVFLYNLFSEIISKEWPVFNNTQAADKTNKVVNIISSVLRKDAAELGLPKEDAPSTPPIPPSTDGARNQAPMSVFSFLKPKYISHKTNKAFD